MESPISTNPEILSGAAAFRGTRVFIQSLFDYVAAGNSLETYLIDFPSVSREQALEVLALAGQALLASIPTPEQVRLTTWIPDDALALRCIPETGTNLLNLLGSMDALDHSIVTIQRLNETLCKLRGTGLIVSDGEQWHHAEGILERIAQFIPKPKRYIQDEIKQWFGFLQTLTPTADQGPEIDRATYDEALHAYQRRTDTILAKSTGARRRS